MIEKFVVFIGKLVEVGVLNEMQLLLMWLYLENI